MSLSTRALKEANLSPEVVLDDMLARAFERFDSPRPAQLEKYDVLRGILPTHVNESSLALTSLIFVADARYQYDNVTGEDDNNAWAGIIRDRFYRKNGQINRIFSPRYVEMQDALVTEIKGDVAEMNPEVELVGPEYAMCVVAGELVLPNSIEAPVAKVMQLSTTSREVA